MKPSGSEEEGLPDRGKMRCSIRKMMAQIVNWMSVKQGSKCRLVGPLLHMGINQRAHAPYVCHTLHGEKEMCVDDHSITIKNILPLKLKQQFKIQTNEELCLRLILLRGQTN